LAGVRRGEPGVYATLSETEEELRDVASSHGWSLDGVTICDLQTSEESLKADSQYTLFHPAEVELSETTRTVLEAVELIRPKRVVFDSLSEIRLLARDSLRYRRQILALKHYFTGRSCTVLLLDYGLQPGEFQLQSLTHGVLSLERQSPNYGGERRRLKVQKVRGIAYHEGFQDYVIRKGGLQVFPRLIAAQHHDDFVRETVSSGLLEIDSLLGGGISSGSSTMILGPSGVGKSTLAAQYVSAAAARGEKACVYSFEESPESWIERPQRLGMQLREHEQTGRIGVRQVDPAELSPGELAEDVRRHVEQGVKMVVIDSLNGFRNAMAEEQHLILHLHELLSYLNQQGVTTLINMAQYGILGDVSSPVELSYLADNVILMRYFEAFGQVRQAISVVKKRTGSHERSVRELRISDHGLRVGRELREFHGVLAGQLSYLGEAQPLLGEEVHA
jgi:circadian clock protein KaiC